jgi:cytochrome c
VALVSRVVRAASLAALGALAACSAPEPPPAAPAPPAPTTAAAASSGAEGFDAGPVRSPAEYLAEPRFAAADLERGRLLSLACAACHTLGAGEGTIVGPNLHGVFGRRAGAVDGFDYSPGLAASGLVWTPVSLEAWLTEPASFIAGTKMAFTGYRSPEDRRDLLAYLLRATQ